MRVLIDANVIISYLLGNDSQSPPRALLRRFLRGDFELLVSELTLAELDRSVRRKPWLVERIALDELDAMVDLLQKYATILPGTSSPLARLTRDPHDDYLVHHAIEAEADFLISGDRDLLILGSVSSTVIISPASFVQLLTTIANRGQSSENGG